MDDSRIRLHQWDEDRPKFCVPACKLDRKGWENELEVAPIQEVPRAEERGSELSICEYPLRDRLRNGALPRPGQPVQPVDAGLTRVLCPEFNSVQDGSARSFEATIALAMSKLGSLCTAEITKDSSFGCQSFMSDTRRPEWRTF